MNLRRIGRSLASSTVEGAITLSRIFFETHALRILYYHSVNPSDDHISCLRPERFAAQMYYLAEEGYRVLPLDKVPAYLQGGKPFPPKSVVLTFDDGFQDNYTHAYPVLVELGFSATIFLVVEYVGSETLPVFTRYLGQSVPLSWNEIEEMSRNGISFGSHSLTHRELTRLDPGEMEWEVVESKKRIEERLGKEAHFFCYPRGFFDERVKAIVARAGYSGACTIRPGASKPGVDLFALPRVYIGRDDTLGDFRKKLKGAYDLLHKGRQMGRLALG